MRSLLIVTIVSGVSISGAWNVAAQNNIFDARSSPAVAAQQDFERAVAEYKKCLADNQGNVKACEGLHYYGR